MLVTTKKIGKTKELEGFSYLYELMFYHNQNGTYYFRAEDWTEKIAIRPGIKLDIKRGEKYKFVIKYKNG